ncbi:MAG: sensor histidine kinase [Bacteroidota bacterium]
MQEKYNILDRLIQNRILRHVLFWFIVLMIAPLTSEGGFEDMKTAFVFRAVGLPTKIAATYFIVYYLIPNFFQKKRYSLAILWFFVATYVFTVIYRINNVYIAESIVGYTDKESISEILTSFNYTVLGYFYRTYAFTWIFLVLKVIKDQAVKQRAIERLEKEKATAELNFLKAQIHPHFLFNTLNNLYALTLDKSDDAPEVVAKLSEMLDYMLYQCNEPKVLIKKEVELLEYYIDLEKLRYGDRLQLSFKHHIDNTHTQIAPLILISLVENSFKHGVSGALQQPEIQIDLEVKNQILNMRVFNTKAANAQHDSMSYKEGIGVKNIQRQLDLVYAERYDWKVKEGREFYEVNLRIEL